MATIILRNRVLHKIRAFKDYRLKRCNRPDLRVACILDEFSYECFKPECNLKQLQVGMWRTQLQQFKPHFLLVESAWLGAGEKWRHQIISIEKKAKTPIRQVIAYCNRHRIKTVFWNKEDPVHYTQFLSTAKLFDYIFTTDARCVDRYKKDIGHQRVYPLPFAAQPAIHHPINSSYSKKENVAFAGTWYNNKKRQNDMKKLLDSSKAYGLHIFDRRHRIKGPNSLVYPKTYNKNIIDQLSYAEMVKAYRLYKIFLNVNTVTESPTMFSRRVFEILASGGNMISSYAKGIQEMFGGIVQISDSNKNTTALLIKLINDEEYSRRLSIRGIREVHFKHLYGHRFNFILEKTGISHPAPMEPGVSMIVCLENEKLFAHVLEQYNRQAWKDKELIVVTSNKRTLEKMAQKTESIRGVSFYQAENERKSKQLNAAIAKCRFPAIAFIHENYYYAPHYLTDLMHAFRYTNASIIGKKAHYRFDEKQEVLLLCNPNDEYRFVSNLPLYSSIVKKHLFQKLQFNEETLDPFPKFLQDCIKAGYKLFSSDKYNFIQVDSTKDYQAFVTV